MPSHIKAERASLSVSMVKVYRKELPFATLPVCNRPFLSGGKALYRAQLSRLERVPDYHAVDMIIQNFEARNIGLC